MSCSKDQEGSVRHTGLFAIKCAGEVGEMLHAMSINRKAKTGKAVSRIRVTSTKGLNQNMAPYSNYSKELAAKCE